MVPRRGRRFSSTAKGSSLTTRGRYNNAIHVLFRFTTIFVAVSFMLLYELEQQQHQLQQQVQVPNLPLEDAIQIDEVNAVKGDSAVRSREQQQTPTKPSTMKNALLDQSRAPQKLHPSSFPASPQHVGKKQHLRPHKPQGMLSASAFQLNLMSHYEAVETNLATKCQNSTTNNGTDHHKLAFFIPLLRTSNIDQQQQAESHLKLWLDYMRDVLPGRIIEQSHVFIIEQEQANEEASINQGFIFNVGFDYVFVHNQHHAKPLNQNGVSSSSCGENGPFDYIVLQDVRIRPSNETASFAYDYRSQPTRLASSILDNIPTTDDDDDDTPLKKSNLHDSTNSTKPIDTIAFMITPVNYQAINGYSNRMSASADFVDLNTNVAKRIEQVLGSPPTSLQKAEFFHHWNHKVTGIGQFRYNASVQNDTTGISSLDYTIRHSQEFSMRGWNVTRILVTAGDDLETPRSVRITNAMKAAKNKNKLSCDQIFGMQSLRTVPLSGGMCVEHVLLHFMSCRLGQLIIHPSRIEGSIGGEVVSSVLGRSATNEQLTFGPDAIIASHPIPAVLNQSSLVAGARRFVALTKVEPELVFSYEQSVEHDKVTQNFLVERGDYANPCMAVSKMYNTFVAIHAFNTSRHRIIFLDGHARSNIDELWEILFDEVMHLKQLQEPEILNDSILINTVSTIGDEGLHVFNWDDERACKPQSTLHRFRDFVLKKLEISRSTADTKRLTLLVRRNYLSNPRGDGIIDRSLANETDDAMYIQSEFPKHTVQVVSFEGIHIIRQIEIVSQTDVLVAVHGAGNILVMFLPNHGTLIEFFPFGFLDRLRFKYIALSMNLTYEDRFAERVQLLSGERITVRLRPVTER